MRPIRPIGLISAVALLAACDPLSMNEETKPLRKWNLLSEAHAAAWKPAEIEKCGAAKVAANEAVLDAGEPITGLRFEHWQKESLPLQDYTITCEAMRVEGRDFFAAITFPVRSIDTCCTFVAGGWGGALTGISSIDGMDAADNETRSEQKFANGKWHRLKIEVRADKLTAWIDDRLVLGASIQNRRLSLRPGDIEKCAPFGLATYATKGRVRNLVISEHPPTVIP